MRPRGADGRFSLERLGKYEIIEELGRGAMGVVYKARDPLIGRLVALKTITSGLAEQPEMLERFYREAQAAGGLQHPNIVTIYDLGKEGNTPYIAMEFLVGESIERIIEEQRPLPLSQKIGYVVQVCRALDYAHKRGVVHRDIKPANIVVTGDGTIKVVDFGIARLVDTSRSQTGLLIGTVNYMSPEQVRGERVDGRSDIFSVGVMFYELLSYTRPFVGNNFTAVMLAIISQEPKPITQLVPDCPPGLDPIFQKLFRKDVADRFQSMEEALLELDPIYKELQQQACSQLVEQSQQLIQKKELEKARDLLKQALLIDTAHTKAKTLLEKINAELRRSLSVPKLREMVKHGESLLKEGKLAEAKAEAEAALKLDTSFEEAKALIQHVQAEEERHRKVREMLRATEQQIAEGALTQAEQHVDRLLELSADSPEARALKKQIAEEKERRSRRQRLSDGMQRARSFWTQQKFPESIEVLTGLEKEFPGEAEVAKLLDTVRDDYAEQIKHEKLAEAKNLLAEQKFSEALAVLDALLEKHKDDRVVVKLREQVLEERKEHARRVRLQHEQQALKKLLNEEKYRDAIEKGSQLLKEFPDDFELTRMVEFARTEHQQLEQRRKLEAALHQLTDLMSKGAFDKAIAAAEKALGDFPGHHEITQTLERARTELKEKEKREFVEKQIRSIKSAIDNGNLTEAIEMGRQTIVQVGHDTDITRLLQFAEREHEIRAETRARDEQMKTAIFLLKDQKFDEATKVLEDLKKTQVFDPRVHSLLEAARAKEADAPQVQDLAQTIIGKPEYAFRAPEAAPPGATVVGVLPAEPMVTPPPPPPPPPAAPPKKPAKGKPVVEEEAPPPVKEPVKEKKPAVEAPPPAKAKPAVEAPPAEKPKPVEAPKAKPAVEAPPVEKPKPVEPPKAKPAVEAPPAVKPAPKVAEVPPAIAVPPVEKPFWAQPIGIAVIAVVVLGAGVGGYFALKSGGAKTETAATETAAPGQPAGNPIEQQQKALMEEANTLADKENYSGAIQKVDDALKLNGPLNSQLQQLRRTFSDASANVELLRQERTLWDQAMAAMNANRFDQAETALKKIVALKEGGRRRADAQQYLSAIIPQRKQDEKNIADAKRLANSNNPADLTGAKGLLESVIKGNGPRVKEAQELLPKVQAKIDQLGKDAVIAAAQSAGRDALQRGDYAAARSQVDEIRNQGGDPSGLQGEISRAEQNRLSQLEGQFNRFRSAQDTNGLQQVQGEYRRFADASGNATARDFADNRVPAAIREVEGARAAAETTRRKQQEETAFNDAERELNQARDSAAVRRAQAKFEQIAQGGGDYASRARDTVATRIPALLKSLMPVPGIVCPKAAAGGMKGAVDAGAQVNCGELDEKLVWTKFDWPEFPAAARSAGQTKGTALLLIAIDQDGNVASVTPRGAKDPHGFFDAAAAAAKTWKTNPPRAQGKPVKTTFGFDVPFSQ